jgi:hypothetical protein
MIHYQQMQTVFEPPALEPTSAQALYQMQLMASEYHVCEVEEQPNVMA